MEPTGFHGVTRNVQWGAEDCHWSAIPQRPLEEGEETDYCGFFSDFVFSMCCVMATANLSNSSLVTSWTNPTSDPSRCASASWSRLVRTRAGTGPRLGGRRSWGPLPCQSSSPPRLAPAEERSGSPERPEARLHISLAGNAWPDPSPSRYLPGFAAWVSTRRHSSQPLRNRGRHEAEQSGWRLILRAKQQSCMPVMFVN